MKERTKTILIIIGITITCAFIYWISGFELDRSPGTGSRLCILAICGTTAFYAIKMHRRSKGEKI